MTNSNLETLPSLLHDKNAHSLRFTDRACDGGSAMFTALHAKFVALQNEFQELMHVKVRWS